MVSQRIYGLTPGYEDLNDHEQLRTDPVFDILVGREDLAPLAGKSTLNRLETGTGINNRYEKITFRKEAVDELMVSIFIESYKKAPAEIVLDIDTTDLPLHGNQEGRVFHGYYGHYSTCEISALERQLPAHLQRSRIAAHSSRRSKIIAVYRGDRGSRERDLIQDVIDLALQSQPQALGNPDVFRHR
jgi:hypothetical protein